MRNTRCLVVAVVSAGMLVAGQAWAQLPASLTPNCREASARV